MTYTGEIRLLVLVTDVALMKVVDWLEVVCWLEVVLYVSKEVL